MRRLAKVGLRILTGLGVLFVAVITLALVFRLALVEWALRHALADAGATNVVVTVTELSPHRLELQPLGFAIGGQALKVDQITVERPDLFSRSLGRVKVVGAAATLALTPGRPATILAQKASEQPATNEPSREFPFEQVQVEGHITLAFQNGSRVLSIDLEAKPVSRSRVGLNVHAAAPGLAMNGRGEFDLTARSGEMTLENCHVDLQSWQDLWAVYLPPEAAGWTLDGTVTGNAHGKLEQGAVSGTAALHLRDGTVRNETKKASAAGITTDVSVAMRQIDGRSQLQVEAGLAGPGLSANGHGEYDFALGSGDFAVGDIHFELKPWSDFLMALAPAAAARFKLDGAITGDAHGHVEKETFTGVATLHLRDGSLRNPAKGISAEGITGDLVFPQIPNLVSAPRQMVQMARAQIGAIALQRGEVDLQVASGELVTVNAASVEAFGGRLSTEPFGFNPSKAEYSVTVLADGVQIASVLALFPDSPVKADGEIRGRVPVRFDGTGLHFGQGWAELVAGHSPLVLFSSPGLLTGRLSPKNPAYVTLQRIETGQTRLKVEGLHLDLHPADAPADRSAQLRIVGRPDEPGTDLGALTLDININGPLEDLMNWGLQTDISASAGAR